MFNKFINYATCGKILRSAAEIFLQKKNSCSVYLSLSLLQEMLKKLCHRGKVLFTYCFFHDCNKDSSHPLKALKRIFSIVQYSRFSLQLWGFHSVMGEYTIQFCSQYIAFESIFTFVKAIQFHVVIPTVEYRVWGRMTLKLGSASDQTLHWDFMKEQNRSPS